jgi:Peptidase family M28
MDNTDASGPKGPSRRLFLSASAVAAAAVPLASQATAASAASGGTRSSLPHLATPDPALVALLRKIDPNRIQATIEQLITFGTRHTASSQNDPVHGIGAAYTWVFQQMQAIAEDSQGNMTVQQQTFIQQPVPGRLAAPTSITNTILTMQGTANPQRFYVVTGHLDSRVTDLLDSTSDAPGADDDGSGVACVLELARVFAQAPDDFPGTIIFAAVSGEEEGLFGSSFMAKQMAAAGNDVQGMFSNDIIGTGDAHDGSPPDPFTVRMFLEGIPTNATSSDVSLMQAVGGENDGKARQLGRFVAGVAPASLTGMNIRLIWRRDRYLRASDHVSFQGQGYAAARFTEPRENFNHEHQNTQVVNGVQLGDLIQYVDFNYVAGVTRVNAAALWALATSPSTPKNAQIHTTPPVSFAGTNFTTITWNANPESNLVGYEIVMRETTVPDWTSAIPVGNVTTVTLNISKDNVQFGVRAVDQNGNRSPVAFPAAVA